MSALHGKRKRPTFRALVDRPLPETAITALLRDGHNPAVVAAAFDVPSQWVKRVVEATLIDLLRQAGLRVNPFMRVEVDTRLTISWRRVDQIIEVVENHSQLPWEDMLSPREQLEVVEVRTYMRAFVRARA